MNKKARIGFYGEARIGSAEIISDRKLEAKATGQNATFEFGYW